MIKYHIRAILKGISCASILILASTATSQDLYLSTVHNKIYRLEQDYTLTHITTSDYPKTITDIAFSSEGNLYGIASTDIVEIDLQTGETDFLKQLPQNDYSTSLACSHENKLYLIGFRSDVIYAYDIATQSFQLINYLNQDLIYDVTFYRGNIFYQSIYGYYFVAYDIQEKTKSKVACQPRYLQMHGLSSVMDSCGTEIVYAFDQYSRLYQINFELHKLDNVYNFDLANGEITGMASISEHHGSLCYEHFEPVECDNTVGVATTSTVSSIIAYPSPAQDFLMIESDTDIEELHIYDFSGKLAMSMDRPAHTIDVRDLTPGIYILQIFSDGEFLYQKIVVE